MKAVSNNTSDSDSTGQGNPQGKGLVPILQHWRQYQPRHVPPKPAAQLLSEYATSLLVLSARFNFRPIPGKPYYLYLKQRCWRLSMIEPQRWDRRAGIFLGRCELQQDMTWTLQPRPDHAADPELCEALRRFQDSLIERLNSAGTVAGQLPYYVAELPFYQRLAANGLATSVELSAGNSGLLQQPASHWLGAAAVRKGLLPLDSDVAAADA